MFIEATCILTHGRNIIFSHSYKSAYSLEAALFFSYEGSRREFAGIFLDKRERIPEANDLKSTYRIRLSFLVGDILLD